jgi:hypothetical protein
LSATEQEHQQQIALCHVCIMHTCNDRAQIAAPLNILITPSLTLNSHRMARGESLPGPLQHFAFRVPLSDLQPVDLLQLVKQQEAQQQEQQQQHRQQTNAGTAAAASPLEGAEGLGSLEDFLAPQSGGEQDATAQAAGATATHPILTHLR